MKLICLGDSIMAEYDAKSYPQAGWVQVLKLFFNNELEICNFGVGKMSTRTCFEYGQFDKALEVMDNDSYVVINFGHNDRLEFREERYVTLEQFKTNLNIMIDKVQEKGSTPILCTPTNILKLDEDGNLFKDNMGLYPQVVRDVAKERNILLVDFYDGLFDIFTKLGYENSKRLVMTFNENIYYNFINGSNDSHLRYDGAYEVARMFVKKLIEVDHPLSKYLVGKIN